MAVRDERHLHLQIRTEPTGSSAFHIGFDSRKESVLHSGDQGYSRTSSFGASPSNDAKSEANFRAGLSIRLKALARTTAEQLTVSTDCDRLSPPRINSWSAEPATFRILPEPAIDNCCSV